MLTSDSNAPKHFLNNIFKLISSIQYTPYTLTPKYSLNAKHKGSPRRGVLLRINFKDCGTGYADCHPWEELGDANLTIQLDLLSKQQLTALTSQSICLAYQDAKRRANNDFLLPKLSNHLLATYEAITNEYLEHAQSSGFRYLKLKFGKNLQAEVAFIKEFYTELKKHQLKLRLDFNSILTFAETKSFLNKIKTHVDIIDFIEDPCPFGFHNWQFIQGHYGVSLALDRKPEAGFLVEENSYSAFRVLVLKPAVDNIAFYKHNLPHQRVVFTSYMDHGIGQLSGIYDAADFYKIHPGKLECCGFLTHQAYVGNEYFNLFEVNATALTLNSAHSNLLDSLLLAEKWEGLI